MPLSEHEQRQLEAIERALYADDPKFAQHVRFADPRTRERRRIVLDVLVVVVGLGVLLGGAITGIWYVGVAGFLIMLVGATWIYGSVRRLTGRDDHADRADRADRAALGPQRRLADRGPHGPRQGDGRGGVASFFRGPRFLRGPRGGRAPGARARFVERCEERWRRRFEI